MIKTLLKNRIFGWSLYVLIVVSLITYLVSLIINEELSDITLNQGNIYTKNYILNLNINEIDYSKNKINCDFEILKEFEQSFQVVFFIISSIRDTVSTNENSELCFTYPSRNEIVNIVDIYKKQKKQIVPNISEFYGHNFDFSFSPNGNTFSYPFDKYNVQLDITIIGNVKPIPNFEIRLRDNISDLNIVDFHQNSDLNFSFQFVRSRFIRFFTIFIYTIAFLTLIFIGFKQSVKDILFQGLGYFIALWGIRDIITGNVSYFPTLIDFITIILTTLLVLIIIGRLLSEYYNSKNDSTLPNNVYKK